MNKILDHSFFTLPAEELAQQLLGKILCHRIPDEEEPIRFRITVTEAYLSTNDEASYANYKTGKAITFLKKDVGSCCIYVGMILISCGEANEKGCHDNVLIRGGYNIAKEEGDNFHDRGKGQPVNLSKAMQLVSDYPTRALFDENGSLWIEDDDTTVILASPKPRINVPEEKRLRFSIQLENQIGK